MRANQLISLYIPLMFYLISLGACEKKAETAERGASISGLQAMPDSFAVNGSLNIPTEAAGVADAAGKTVQLLSDSGQVVAEAVTGSSGSFQIQVGGEAGLKLQEESKAAKSAVAMPQLMRLRSLFLTNGAQLTGEKDALGLLKPLIIDPQNMKSASGTYSVDTGSHDAEKVGAIYGKISLETGADPTGIDVYIPGTTYIAKTDGEGQFLLGFLPAGTYEVRADKDGYNSIEWPKITVKKQETTPLPDAIMSISVGPKIETFELDSLSQADGIASLRLRIKSATKYRISALADFSDTQFNPLDAAIPEFTIKFPLAVGVQFVKIYLEAADSGGLSANATLTIDREAPSKGSVTAVTTNGYINSLDVPLLISAEGATRMKIGESQTALDAATWIAFAASHTHTLASATNGTRKLMVAFADDAGNTYGLGGEIQTSFILDTISPADGVISLLPPESPTGAFNTPLAWLADYGEPMSYAIEVSSSAAFASILRTMESTQANTVINPPLETEGTYYWRVRAIDAAGNQSSWVPSGAKNSFKVVIMAQSYQAQFDIKGEPGVENYFGKSMINLGDLNNDGQPELAFAVLDGNTSECSDCGVVKIFNTANRNIVATLSENLPHTDSYGHKILTCDVTGDGKKELVVAAPAESGMYSGVEYHNIGAIYIYDLQSMTRLARRSPTLTPVDDAIPGYSYCSVWDYNANKCSEYGWSYWPEVMPSIPWSDGYFYGWDIACVENSSGASQLAVGAPNYSSSHFYGMGYREGMVELLVYSAGNLVVQDTIFQESGGTRTYAEESFGAGLGFLNSFRLTGDTSHCGGSGAGSPTLVIGAPRRYVGWSEMGGADLYQMNSGSWTKCDTSLTVDSASEPSYSYFGVRIFNLGDVDKDTHGIEELAIASSTWNGGLIKFYDGSGTSEQKRFISTDGNLSRLGFQIVATGDLDEKTSDPSYGFTEIAITIPGAYVNGKWSSGQVSIYKWGQFDLNNGNDATTSPFLTILGKPQDGAFLGADLVPIRQTSSIHSPFKYAFISKPGVSIAGEWSVGAFAKYANIKMAPTAPYRVTGNNSGARLGADIVAAGNDYDFDNVSDFLITQPGGRCEGRPFGAVSLFSVLDNQITHSICSNPEGSTWDSEVVGRQVKHITNSKRIIFSNKNDLFSLNDRELFYHDDTATFPYDAPSYDSYKSSYVGWNFLFSDPWSYSNSSDWTPNDLIMVGDKDYGYSVDTTGSSSWEYRELGRITVLNSNLNKLCYYFGETDEGDFGFHSGFGPAIPNASNGGAVGPDPTMVVGAPESAVTIGSFSGKGKVYLIPYNPGQCTGEVSLFYSGTNLDPGASSYSPHLTISAADDVITDVLNESAKTGFGRFVLQLPDLDGIPADPLLEPENGVAFFYVANTNAQVGTSTVVPQYFIFKITYNIGNNSYGTTLLKYETGEAGSMLGGFAKVVDDINGDGVVEIAISSPGGIGRFGKTGQVRIISGAGLLTTANENDDLMQMLYNPDPNVSNFGVSVDYNDITGDGLKDFVIGADRYDTPAYQDAGAVYVFPVEPIQN